MPRKRKADFDQAFLDLVEAPPSLYTAEEDEATKIERRQKRRLKDYYIKLIILVKKMKI